MNKADQLLLTCFIFFSYNINSYYCAYQWNQRKNFRDNSGCSFATEIINQPKNACRNRRKTKIFCIFHSINNRCQKLCKNYNQAKIILPCKNSGRGEYSFLSLQDRKKLNFWLSWLYSSPFRYKCREKNIEKQKASHLKFSKS